MAITSYPNLRNRGGEIYDKATGKRYSNPTQLANDLGILPHEINWSAIANEAPAPSSTPAPAPAPAPSPTPINQPPAQQPQQENLNAWANSFVQGESKTIPIHIRKFGSVDAYLEDLFKNQLGWDTARKAAIRNAVKSQFSDPGNTVSIPTGAPELPNIAIPKELADNPMFQALSEQDKTSIAYAYYTSKMQSEQRNQLYDEAMQKAGEQADPYWREKINIMKDEARRALEAEDVDLATREKKLMTQKQRIEDDLTYNKQYLSLEEAAELSRQKDTYDKELQDTRETMASRGLTESSIRNQAEERMAKSYGDITGSVQRKYARMNRDTQVASERDVEDVKSDIENLRASMGIEKTRIVREKEKYLGSSELGALPGAKSYLLGGVTGEMTEDKAANIYNRGQNLLNKELMLKGLT